MRRAGLMIAGWVATMVACGSPATPPASTAAPVPGAPADTASAPAPSAPGGVSVPAGPAVNGAAPTPAVGAAPAPGAASGLGAPAAAPAPAAPPAPVFKEVTLPAGTSLAIELKSPLSSATAAVEDPVEGVLRRALVVDGAEIVPAGTMVSGSVTAAERSGRVKGRARLALRFTTLVSGDETLPIATAVIARQAQATKGRDAAKVGIGAGAGALVGAIAGGKKGAVVGGTVGAGAGTGVVLATRGDEVVLGAGASLTTTLTTPLVLRLPVE